MNKNILTIAVPFRLSLEDLNTCLESIEKQFENPKIMEPIEVLVSCNSMDKDVCKDFDLFMGEKFASFISLHTPSGLSYDNHLRWMVHNSSSEYIKFLAEDDKLIGSFLASFLESIKMEPEPLSVVNCFSIFKFGQEEVGVPRFSWTSSSMARRLKTISIINILNESYGQISALAFKRSFLLRNLAEDLEDSNYLHVFWFLQALSYQAVSVISEVYILVKEGSPNFSRDIVQEIKTPIGALFAIHFSRNLPWQVRQSLLFRQSRYLLYTLTAINRCSKSELHEIRKIYFRAFLDFPVQLFPQMALVLLPQRFFGLFASLTWASSFRQKLVLFMLRDINK